MFTLHQKLVNCRNSKISTNGKVIITTGHTGISIYKRFNGNYELFQKIRAKVALSGNLEISSDGQRFICKTYDSLERHVLKIYKNKGKYELYKEFIHDDHSMINNFGANLSVNNDLTTIVTAKDYTSPYFLIHVLEEDGEWSATMLPKVNAKERSVVFPRVNKKGDRITVETIYGFYQNETRVSKYMARTYQKQNGGWEKVLETDDVIEHLIFNTKPGEISVSVRRGNECEQLLTVVENNDGVISITKLDDNLGKDRTIRSHVLPEINLITINSNFINNKETAITFFKKIGEKWHIIKNSLTSDAKITLSASEDGYLIAGNKLFKVAQ